MTAHERRRLLEFCDRVLFDPAGAALQSGEWADIRGVILRLLAERDRLLQTRSPDRHEA